MYNGFGVSKYFIYQYSKSINLSLESMCQNSGRIAIYLYSY